MAGNYTNAETKKMQLSYSPHPQVTPRSQQMPAIPVQQSRPQQGGRFATPVQASRPPHPKQPQQQQQAHPQQQKSRPQSLPMTYQSKYGELLNVIEDLGREIKPTYAGSKMAQERLKKGIMHARALVRECLAEVDKSARQ